MLQLKKHQNRYPIISVIQSRSQLSMDMRFKKRYLFHAISNLNLMQVEFTSFYDINNKYEITRRNKIKQYPLPMALDDVCSIINKQTKSFFEESRKWPGGIRAKIPQ